LEAKSASGDGRVQRGERNRKVIVEAVVELVRAGNIRPTAEQVARRAGVGTRTVFRHFDDMESLHAEMNELVTAEILPLLEDRHVLGNRSQRVQELVRWRVRIFERIAPFKRASNHHRPRSAYLQEKHAELNRRLRADIAACLEAELKIGAESLLDAVDLITSFEVWDRLRSDQRLGRDRAARVVEQSLHALLARYEDNDAL
jgi:AcrR family transcriptional regulator